ncbi:MAG: hypothetical protein SNJ78_03065 [Spirochaetales bacterium]
MGSKNRRRRKVQKQEGMDIPLIKPNIEVTVCPLCGNPIQEVYLSLLDPDLRQAVHFDCALRKIREKEPVQNPELVVYLGSGTFGVLDSPPGTGHFSIRKRIPYEDKETASHWRKQIAYSLS